MKFGTTTLALLGIVFSGTAHATLIHINSQAGLATSAGPTTVTINPHPLWQSNNPVNPGDSNDTSAVWISHQDSGYQGSQFQPYQGMTLVMSVFHSFWSGAGNLILKVWADDTAGVFLDGNQLFAPVFTQSTCSGQAIGCRPQDFALINTAITAGFHTLRFDTYQVGTGTNTTSNPFGLLYTGTAPSAVPEPSTMAVAAAGIAALACLRRQR